VWLLCLTLPSCNLIPASSVDRKILLAWQFWHYTCPISLPASVGCHATPITWAPRFPSAEDSFSNSARARICFRTLFEEVDSINRTQHNVAASAPLCPAAYAPSRRALDRACEIYFALVSHRGFTSALLVHSPLNLSQSLFPWMHAEKRKLSRGNPALPCFARRTLVASSTAERYPNSGLGGGETRPIPPSFAE
jgi:hypothetical protein